MRDFIDYLQEEFITASGGNAYDNSYSNLDLTARSLLGFYTPSGSRITLSSFVRPKFGTSYSIGIKDGWISYLFSSLPLSSSLSETDNPLSTSSDQIPLPDLLRCYRPLSSQPIHHAVGHSLVYGRMYLPQSRLEALVASRVTREVNLTLRAVSSQGDDFRPQGGATVLGLAAWDDPAGRFGIETLASTDGGVLGLRGLWNASNPPSDEAPPSTTTTTTTIPDTQQPVAPSSSSSSSSTIIGDSSSNAADKERINGRFSVGGEIYYGLLNKSGGVSLGGRFQTLPTHHGTPLTATLTFNLLGHIRATYAVVAGNCTLASCFGFNLYSYESEWAVGIELWSRRKRSSKVAAVVEKETEVEKPTAVDTDTTFAQVASVEVEELKPPGNGEGSVVAEAPKINELATTIPPPSASPPPLPIRPYKERSFQAKLEWRLDDDNETDEPTAATVGQAIIEEAQQRTTKEGDFPAGVLKARCDQHMRIGLLYEGRYKALLFSLGTDVDFRKLDAPFRTVGLAVQYSS